MKKLLLKYAWQLCHLTLRVLGATLLSPRCSTRHVEGDQLAEVT